MNGKAKLLFKLNDDKDFATAFTVQSDNSRSNHFVPQTSLPVKLPILEEVMVWGLPSFFSPPKYKSQLTVLLETFYLQNA